MTDKKPCRWGPLIRQASVLGRFKNKLRLKKLEWKRFYEQMWGPTHPTAESETEFQEWADSHHGSEGSTCSNYNSQYFDSLTPEEALELFQQAQIPSLEDHQSSVPIMPSRFQQELQGMCVQQGGQEFVPMVGNGSLDTMLLDLHHGQQLPTPWMDHMDSFDSAPLSVNEYLDAENTDECADAAFSEWLQLDEQMRIERNLSSAMSIDSTGNMEMRHTGESSIIPMRPEDRLQWFKKFFEIGAEEALTGPRQASGGRGWRVMVRIVCACRKLSRLLRNRKMEKKSAVRISPPISMLVTLGC